MTDPLEKLPVRRAREGGLTVSMLGLGCMGMSEFYGTSDDEKSRKLLETAIERGVRFFDTADVYGCGHNEKLVGGFLRDHDLRKDIVLATKGGIVRDKNETTRRGIDTSPEYLRETVGRSLDRLGTHIDLYYLHRVEDRGTRIEASMEALADMLAQGMIGAVGLSEVSAEVIRRADAALRKLTGGTHGLTAVQTEYSLMTRNVEVDGVDAICRELGILLVAYSPICRGLLANPRFQIEALDADDFRRSLPRFMGENLATNLQLVSILDEVAKNEGATPAQVALAWVLSRGPHVVPIPGTRNPDRLAENIEACRIDLSPRAIEQLESAFAPHAAAGLRYTSAAMAAYSLEA